MELSCSLLQSADKKLWLFLRKTHCSGGSSPQNADSKQSAVAKASDEEIAQPTVELWHHCLLRGANLGSVASIVFGTPVLLYKGVRQPTALLQQLAGISTYGVVSAKS